MSSNQTLINSHNLCYCSSVDIAQCSCHRYQITTGIIPSKEHSNIKCNVKSVLENYAIIDLIWIKQHDACIKTDILSKTIRKHSLAIGYSV